MATYSTISKFIVENATTVAYWDQEIRDKNLVGLWFVQVLDGVLENVVYSKRAAQWCPCF